MTLKTMPTVANGETDSAEPPPAVLFDTGNPCIKLCRFDAAGECLGCRRTRTEVKAWKRLPDAAKAAINARIRALGVSGVPRGKKKDGAKRLRKLARKIAKLEAKLSALRAERDALSQGGSGRPVL